MVLWDKAVTMILYTYKQLLFHSFENIWQFEWFSLPGLLVNMAILTRLQSVTMSVLCIFLVTVKDIIKGKDKKVKWGHHETGSKKEIKRGRDSLSSGLV